MSDSKVKMFDAAEVKSAYQLKEGDVLESTNLGLVSFERWKRGMQSYICIQLSSGTRYKTRVPFRNDTFKVIGKAIIEKPADKYGNDAKNLVAGDLFLIERKNACEVFKFIDYGRTGKINACSPVDDTKQWSIDSSFAAIKIANL